tara:strand:- start:13168 stop:14610 length:1443 start_codon:yes stop_codon:yes gene_type:complete
LEKSPWWAGRKKVEANDSPRSERSGYDPRKALGGVTKMDTEKRDLFSPMGSAAISPIGASRLRPLSTPVPSDDEDDDDSLTSSLFATSRAATPRDGQPCDDHPSVSPSSIKLEDGPVCATSRAATPRAAIPRDDDQRSVSPRSTKLEEVLVADGPESDLPLKDNPTEASLRIPEIMKEKYDKRKQTTSKSINALNKAIQFEKVRLAGFCSIEDSVENKFHINRLDARLKELSIIRQFLKHHKDSELDICISGRATDVCQHSSTNKYESYVESVTIWNKEGDCLLDTQLLSSMEVIASIHEKQSSKDYVTYSFEKLKKVVESFKPEIEKISDSKSNINNRLRSYSSMVNNTANLSEPFEVDNSVTVLKGDYKDTDNKDFEINENPNGIITHIPMRHTQEPSNYDLVVKLELDGFSKSIKCYFRDVEIFDESKQSKEKVYYSWVDLDFDECDKRDQRNKELRWYEYLNWKDPLMRYVMHTEM